MNRPRPLINADRRQAREARGKWFAIVERAVWIAVGAMLIAAMATPGLRVIWRML